MILLQITANTGPEECCLAVRKALKVFSEECAIAEVKVEILETVPSEKLGNLRSVLLALEGGAAQLVAFGWRGNLQWSCPSPYRLGHKRKNWFVGVEVFEPDAPRANTDVLLDKDLRFETLRARGPGGQHVNKTDSAVRATHLPSGLTVRVQTERSQHANKRIARALLAHKLAGLASDAINLSRSERWLKHHDVERGNASRLFIGVDFKEVTNP